jgi:hypothetical protein
MRIGSPETPGFGQHSISRWSALITATVILAIQPNVVPMFAQRIGATQGAPSSHDLSELPLINPVANRIADPNRIMEDEMRMEDDQRLDRAFVQQRYRDMTEDAERLLSLASTLKTDVKSERSLTLEDIAVTDQVEKIAHSLKSKMVETR